VNQTVAVDETGPLRPVPKRVPARWSVEPNTAILVALFAVAAALLLYAGRNLTFFYDEWAFILTRRSGGIGTYLDPHNGHLALFPVIVYKILFATVGLRHYTPYRVVAVALHLLCCFFLFKLASRRLGPWLALVPTTLLLFMGSAWQDLLWPFQIGFFTSVAGGLGALLALERRDQRGDVFACALLAWSLSGSDVGLAFLVAAAVALIVQRGPWRRGWIVLVPAVLFGLWYLGWGTSQSITSNAVLAAPQYVADAAAGVAAGIAGLSSTWGAPLAVGGLVALISASRRRPVSPLMAAAVAGALTFWCLAAVARNTIADPTASRYLYIGAAFVWLIVAEALAGVVPSQLALALVAIAVIGALVSNIGVLRAGERGLRFTDDSVRATLAAVEIASPNVPASFPPNPVGAPVVTAGPYLAAVHDLGSPAFTVPELERAPAALQLVADSTLAEADSLGLYPAAPSLTGSSALEVEGHTGGRIVAMGDCRQLQQTASLATIDVRVPVGGTLLMHAGRGGSAQIYLRRFASAFPARRFAVLSPGTSGALRFPYDRARSLPWHVQVNATAPVELCQR
jgi:hypothetical protein